MAPEKNTKKTASKKAAPAKAKAAVKKTAPAKKSAAPKKTTKKTTSVVEAWTPEVASDFGTVDVAVASEKKGRRRFFFFGRRKTQ